MGLFEAIFGKSVPKDDTQPKQAYFLSDDDAKSFGDIEYMRSVKTVRRTFAKKKGQTEHMESIKQISATSASDMDSNGSATPSFLQEVPTASSNGATASAPTPSASVTPQPRRKPASSNDMDMFRNMAKNIRK